MGREHPGNALDVARTRVTGDEMLDELCAHERSDILVLDKVIDGGAEVLLLRLFPGQYEPVQQCLGSPVMGSLPALSIAADPHRITVVWHSPADIGRACQGRCKDPARKDPRVFLDHM